MCSTLLTKVIAKVEQGSLSEGDFDRFKKGARVTIGVETKCRKCKQIISKLVETKA